ncbi:unnamed protein product [Microthlaspi erraticum]|uniref:K Homology domain-containing protein n=1 Tax=Microthlaspi erraticum TaxID=1685480 RepID=A0A6D2HXA8_9BRAS|nr:unnamed protein product [Microthlaspi erraticum]
MVTVRLRLANDIFFDCVKWNHGVLRLVAEKRAPNRHTADAVVFNLREITQESPNVITETSNPLSRVNTSHVSSSFLDRIAASFHESTQVTSRLLSSIESLQGNMSKLVKLHILCPTERIRHVVGRKEATLNSIRTDTSADIRLNATVAAQGFVDVTKSAFETIEAEASPTIAAARNLLPLCSTHAGYGGEYIQVLVEDSAKSCLDDVFISEVQRRSLSVIQDLKANQDAIILIMGKNEEVRTAFLSIMCKLRHHFVSNTFGRSIVDVHGHNLFDVWSVHCLVLNTKQTYLNTSHHCCFN